MGYIWKYISFLLFLFHLFRVLILRNIHAYLSTRWNNDFYRAAHTHIRTRSVKYVGINVWPEQFAFNRLPVIDIGKKFLKMHIFLKVTMPRELECHV